MIADPDLALPGLGLVDFGWAVAGRAERSGARPEIHPGLGLGDLAGQIDGDGDHSVNIPLRWSLVSFYVVQCCIALFLILIVHVQELLAFLSAIWCFFVSPPAGTSSSLRQPEV